VEVQETTHNFGEAVRGETVTHGFTVKNAGSQPLIFEEVWRTDALAAISLKQWLEPGQESKIALALDTSRLKGAVETGVVLHTNDPRQPVVKLIMKGKVKPLVELKPYAALFLSAFQGEAKEGSVAIVNHDSKPLRIPLVECKSEQFRAHLETVKEGREYRLLIKANPEAPPGRFKDTVRLFTDNEKDPEIEIPVKISIKGDVYAFPDHLDFGEIKLKEMEQAARPLVLPSGRVLVARRPGKAGDLQIRVETDLAFIKVEKTPESGGTFYQLTVSPVKEKLPQGNFTGKILVHTTDPETRKLIIPVSGSIL
jgi:hypothetical protein